MNPASIQLAWAEDSAIIKWHGRGTLRESPFFKTFVTRLLDESKGIRVLVDLVDCEYLDSTFLGCLVGLHRRHNANHQSRFELLADGASTARLLAPCHLDKVLPIQRDVPDPDSDWTPIDWESASPEQLGQHVMACHQLLAETPCPQAPAFRRVAEHMEEELRRRAKAPSDS